MSFMAVFFSLTEDLIKVHALFLVMSLQFPLQFLLAWLLSAMILTFLEHLNQLSCRMYHALDLSHNFLMIRFRIYFGGGKSIT